MKPKHISVLCGSVVRHVNFWEFLMTFLWVTTALETTGHCIDSKMIILDALLEDLLPAAVQQACHIPAPREPRLSD
jgi:hypothetical protein